MQILDDIWKSITGNIKSKVTDPIIGAFVISWSLCNWDKLAILFWGKGSVNERVAEFTGMMSVFNIPKLIVLDIDLFILPVVLTGMYIFVFPWVSLWIRGVQKQNIIKQYEQVVSIDIEKSEKQKELNKLILRSDPEKNFLAKEVELDLRVEEDHLTRRMHLTKYIQNKTESSKKQLEIKSIELEKYKIENDSAKIDYEKKVRQEERDKLKHQESIAVHNAVLASNRFPFSYGLMESLSSSLGNDEITISLNGLSDCIAAVFGYENFYSLINDSAFNNENSRKCIYIYHDSDYLTKRFDFIIANEGVTSEYINTNIIFEHVSMVMQQLGFNFLSGESIAEKIYDDLNNNISIILDEPAVNSAMAETDTIFDDVYVEISSVIFESTLQVALVGNASGTHRKDSEVHGQDITFRGVAECTPVLGKFGLSEYKLVINQASPDF